MADVCDSFEVEVMGDGIKRIVIHRNCLQRPSPQRRISAEARRVEVQFSRIYAGNPPSADKCEQVLRAFHRMTIYCEGEAQIAVSGAQMADAAAPAE
jgi:hypothetical protein